MDRIPDTPKPVKLFHTTYCPPGSGYEGRSPVILIHGTGATSGSWNGVVADIGNKTNRKIFCIDQRNHGMSEYPEEYTLEHGIADLENFISEQKLSKAICLGHSHGGRIAMGLAFKRPDLVEKLILEDAFMDVSGHWANIVTKMLGLVDLIKRLPKTMTEKQARELIWTKCEEVFPDEVKIFRQKFNMVIPFYKDKKTGLFKFYFDIDLSKKWGNVEFDLSSNPTYEGKSLVMAAETSRLNQESDLEKLRKHLLDCQVEFIKGLSHTLHIENPSQFIEVVSKFING